MLYKYIDRSLKIKKKFIQNKARLFVYLLLNLSKIQKN